MTNLTSGMGMRWRRAVCMSALAAALAPCAHAIAAQPASFLDSIHRQATLTSTVPENGDQNPYAIVVAPVSAGVIQKDDVLITNFNNDGNLQGLGTTIVAYNPATKKLTTFASLPRNLAGCPGGIGLTTAMTMLKSGWVIVGSAPSADGTTGTKGAGCLIVLDANGKVASIIANEGINMPWGNMATIDNDDTATIFVSNAGFGIGSPDGDPRVVSEQTVVRINLAIKNSEPPQVLSQTVVGSGFGGQPNKDVFLIGPTGLALAADGTLYVSDATGNRITAIWDATTRDHSAGLGRTVTKVPAAAACHGLGAQRASLGGQRAKRPGRRSRSAQRRPDQGAVDRPQQGAKAAGQWRSVRHRPDPGRRRVLFCRGREQHARLGQMSCPFSGKGAVPTRRGLLVRAGGALASAGVATLARAAPQASQSEAELRELFFGPHQGGIATPQQTHSYFAAFDCLAKSRDELVTMLKVWTDAAARMSAGETARDLGQDASVEGPDGASALGLSPGRLTITFGFGAGLFVKDGSDRYGLAAKRPAARTGPTILPAPGRMSPPTDPGASTTSSGSATRGRIGCAAAAIWWRAASEFRSNIGIAPRSTFRSK
jgi:hypothetical protein